MIEFHNSLSMEVHKKTFRMITEKLHEIRKNNRVIGSSSKTSAYILIVCIRPGGFFKN